MVGQQEGIESVPMGLKSNFYIELMDFMTGQSKVDPRTEISHAATVLPKQPSAANRLSGLTISVPKSLEVVPFVIAVPLPM